MVTGATSGIGLVTAKALARQGATVIVVGRNPEKGQATVAGIQKEAGHLSVELMLADLSVQAQVRRLAEEFKARFSHLDVLINNAGGFFLRRRLSADGIELTLALNYFSAFLLTNLLLDKLKTSTAARIVNVSSDAHQRARIDFEDLERRKRYSGMGAYGQSKLALLLFTYELARRLDGTQVTANAVHPGFVATNIWRGNGWLVELFSPLIRLMATSPEQGAATSIYLASSPEVTGITGGYFHKNKAIESAPVSYDSQIAQRLWEISAEMTGLQPGTSVSAEERA